MYSYTRSVNNGIDAPWILGAGFIILVFLFVCCPIFDSIIYPYFKSSRFKPKTLTPSKPKWLTTSMNLQNIQRFHKGPLVVYTKITEPYDTGSKMSGWKKVQEILKSLEIDIHQMDLNEDTCIIQIPKRNFKVGTEPGEFVIGWEDASNGFFEYQMIGNDHLQMAFYNVGGVSYVAGISIYLEHPDVNKLWFNQKLVWKLMDQPDYNFSPMVSFSEVSMEIYHRIKINEPFLITKNEYGSINHWKLNGDKRKFDRMTTPIHSSGYSKNPEYPDDSPIDVKYCHWQNDYVKVSKVDDIQCHVVWNKTRRRIQYLKCDTCNDEGNLVPPPSYRSVL